MLRTPTGSLPTDDTGSLPTDDLHGEEIKKGLLQTVDQLL